MDVVRTMLSVELSARVSVPSRASMEFEAPITTPSCLVKRREMRLTMKTAEFSGVITILLRLSSVRSPSQCLVQSFVILLSVMSDPMTPSKQE